MKAVSLYVHQYVTFKNKELEVGFKSSQQEVAFVLFCFFGFFYTFFAVKDVFPAVNF